MDEDIRDNLKELSKHIEDVARQVGSTKIDVTGLTEMSETLRLNADTVETYVRIQKDRYIE
jgi:regulator of replication initiation timing